MPTNSAHEFATNLHEPKLKILDELLKEADVRRGERHKEMLETIVPIVKKIEKCICTEESRLVTIGSLATGLTLRGSSDVDLCFVTTSKHSNQFMADLTANYDFRRTFMSTIVGLIKKDQSIWDYRNNHALYLPGIKVPLLTLNFGKKIKFDMQFSHYHSLRNTDLLRHFAGLDSRFRMLYIWVKELAIQMRIKDGAFGLLSSYHISLLVAHFLQTKRSNDSSVLPLVTKVFEDRISGKVLIEKVIESLDTPVNIKKIITSKNTDSISDLVVQFVDYFAGFDYYNNAIYIDKAHPVPKKQPLINAKLQIFDPYSDESISNGIHTVEAFSLAMKFVQDRMKKGFFLNTFPQFPEAQIFLHQNQDKVWISNRKFDLA
uniref:NTP_transf_2 domain-containing protein n=1 Tax=Rhabditophanes sp. KR3021 TaxID=114890 RepID=A0AC35UCU1_9BILA